MLTLAITKEDLGNQNIDVNDQKFQFNSVLLCLSLMSAKDLMIWNQISYILHIDIILPIFKFDIHAFAKEF